MRKIQIQTLSKRAIIAGIIIAFLVPGVACWWNSSWLYRVPVSLVETTGTTLTDFQTFFKADTASLISQGKMRGDCGDIRVAYGNDVPINYWIESGCNTAQTKIWVKVSLPANSTTTIYMYYGNPSATSQSNGDLVFDFFDDFNGTSLDTSKWTTVNPSAGTVAISGGQATITSTGDWWGTSDTSLFIISNTSFPGNYVAEVRQTGGTFLSNGWQRMFGLRSGSATNRSMFAFLLDQDASHLTNVYRSADGANAAWYGENSGSPTPSFPIILQIERIGNTVSSYVLGILQNTQTIPGLNYVALTNTIGNISPPPYTSNIFDWIRVYKYATTPPKWSTGAEETAPPQLIPRKTIPNNVSQSIQPLASTNIAKVITILTQVDTLISEAEAKNLDTTTCVKLIDEAKADLAQAKLRKASPITANYYALKAATKLKAAVDCLKALIG